MDKQEDDQKAFREEMNQRMETFTNEIRSEITEQIENVRKDTRSMFQSVEDNHRGQKQARKSDFCTSNISGLQAVPQAKNRVTVHFTPANPDYVKTNVFASPAPNTHKSEPDTFDRYLKQLGIPSFTPAAALPPRALFVEHGWKKTLITPDAYARKEQKYWLQHQY
jgi:hypothetical protein